MFIGRWLAWRWVIASVLALITLVDAMPAEALGWAVESISADQESEHASDQPRPAPAESTAVEDLERDEEERSLRGAFVRPFHPQGLGLHLEETALLTNAPPPRQLLRPPTR